MAKGFINHIIESLKSYPAKVFLVENNDRFLYRSDVQEAFNTFGIEITNGTSLEQRVRFELREPDGFLFLLSQDNTKYLEDIKKQAVSIEFSIANYFEAYHIPSIIELDLSLLEELFLNQPLFRLNKKQTNDILVKLQSEAMSKHLNFDLDGFIHSLNSQLKGKNTDWVEVSRIIAKGISKTINTSIFSEVYAKINEINLIFQESLQINYHPTKNSNSVRKPRIVSKILNYLNFNFNENKIALIVVDGMALWQYELLKNRLPGKKEEDVIYSWLPSITQLSRQAIFRGDTPLTDYRQGPVSEEKLWKSYWMKKGFSDYQIVYQHENTNLPRSNSVSKLAIVLKGLDDKMHSSSDYADLYGLTKNWIERSGITMLVNDLLLNRYTVFITTDHGNIQARGWRNLQAREKLGTNKSGSRSQRHLEYSDSWLAKDFLEHNAEIKNDLSTDEQSIYFSSDLSFSEKESLVSHGGSHILEVLIPFISLTRDE